MKLSDFNQTTHNSADIKPTHYTWDLIFVCLVLLIASSSFIYDSYQERSTNQSIQPLIINLK
jgi:hypothetical protein